MIRQATGKIFFCLFLFFPFVAAAAPTYDLGFFGGTRDIFFSTQELIQGARVRIYASVNNFGTEDVSGHVLFYQGSQLIGESQIVTVRAKGFSDEVYVDFTVPQGSFNIQAKIQGQEPKDENPQNDIALTSLLVPTPPPPPPPLPSDLSAEALAAAEAPPGAKEGPPSSSLPSSGSSGGTPGGTKVGTGEGAIKKEKLALSIPIPPARAATDVVNAAGTPGASTALAEAPSVDIVSDFLKLRIEFSERDWNTFAFRAEVNRNDETGVEWSFGDGTTARGREVIHSFRIAGRYVVAAVATSPTGERAQEKVTLELSFWHLGNWQLWLLLLFLLFVVLLLLFLSQKDGKRSLDDDVEEAKEEMPSFAQASEGKKEEQKVERPVRKRKKTVRGKKPAVVESPPEQS